LFRLRDACRYCGSVALVTIVVAVSHLPLFLWLIALVTVIVMMWQLSTLLWQCRTCHRCCVSVPLVTVDVAATVFVADGTCHCYCDGVAVVTIVVTVSQLSLLLWKRATCQCCYDRVALAIFLFETKASAFCTGFLHYQAFNVSLLIVTPKQLCLKNLLIMTCFKSSKIGPCSSAVAVSCLVSFFYKCDIVL